MTRVLRCADAAESRGEALAGTASRADRFVLIEYPTPWPHKAIDAFGEALADPLAAACASASAKLLLMRTPGDRTPGVRRWAVYDAVQRRALWGEWSTEADLAALVDVVPAEPTDAWSAGPVVLVCTHARHDACCGVRGRPVAAALAAAHPGQVWECTHVGGHRFAGNVVLPLDGTYYGRLDPERAVDVVAAHLTSGRVSAQHLRGFSTMTPAAQAASVEVFRRWGPADVGDVVGTSAVELEPDRWRIEVSGSGSLPPSVTVEVRREERPAAVLSCQAEPAPAESYVVEMCATSRS